MSYQEARAKFKPSFLLFYVHRVALSVVFLYGNPLTDNFIDDAPIWQASYISIINKHVGLGFTATMEVL